MIPVYKDYVSMISLCSKARMKQQQYLKIHTHVCSHASEMLLRVIWQLNYKYLKKICIIFFLLFFFIYIMNCDLKLNENEPGILKDLGYKLRILS